MPTPSLRVTKRESVMSHEKVRIFVLLGIPLRRAHLFDLSKVHVLTAIPISLDRAIN